MIYTAYRFNTPEFQRMLKYPVELWRGQTLDDDDIMVFEGGQDVSPCIYGEINTASHTCFERDMEELVALVSAWNAGARLFGVCRGHQFIHAALGGKLVQNICPAHWMTHPVVGLDNLVNSYHHQGVIIPGNIPDVINVYWWHDVLEMFISKRVLSVQFHPEYARDGLGWFTDIYKEWEANGR